MKEHCLFFKRNRNGKGQVSFPILPQNRLKIENRRFSKHDLCTQTIFHLHFLWAPRALQISYLRKSTHVNNLRIAILPHHPVGIHSLYFQKQT